MESRVPRLQRAVPVEEGLATVASKLGLGSCFKYGRHFGRQTNAERTHRPLDYECSRLNVAA